MAFRAYETGKIQSNLSARDEMKYPVIAEKRGGIESPEYGQIDG